MTRPAVYAVGVTVTIGSSTLLDGVDLTVGAGDWVSVIGPNGAGKSTLLRALCGLAPHTGRVEPFGRPLAALVRRDRAVAQEPRLLLLDEPTSALDIGHQQQVLSLLDRLRAELGLTIVTTMHDLALAAQYGDHLVLVAGGRTVASGPPVQVLTGHHLARHHGAGVEVIRHRGSLVVVPLPHPPPEEASHARTRP